MLAGAGPPPPGADDGRPRPDPRRQVLLRTVDRRLDRSRPVRLAHPPRARRRRGRRGARRTRRVGPHVPRRRPVRLRAGPGPPGPADRTPAEGVRGDRHDRPDDHHEPVLAPGVQGRRVHLQRPHRAAARAAQGAAQRRAGRRARCPHLRAVGRTGGLGVRLREGRPRRPGPLPRGHGPALRVRPGAGPRHPVRDRAQAERAPWRHPAAHRRARSGLRRAARPPRARRGQPRGRARADGRAQHGPRRRPGVVGREAVPHRPERPARHQVRPGPGVRPR